MKHEADRASALGEVDRARVTAGGVLRWYKVRQLRRCYRGSTCEVVLARG